MSTPVRHIWKRTSRWIREFEPTGQPGWKVWGIRCLRIGAATLRDLREGQLSLRAMSLVYTTLLSLVPLLAVSFSVLKGFGVHNQLEPMLLNFLAPMGEQGVQITTTIIAFVENVKAGVLGSVGLGLLIYTVIALMHKIESAFNYVWRVSQDRSFTQRFSGYLSVILIGPVLVFSSLGLTATVVSASDSVVPLAGFLRYSGQIAPFLMVVAAFALIYMFIPNTRVRFISALVGALIAGLLWEIIGWGFASFIVNSPSYTAIYSAFATLIIFMIWLYLSWLILLTGAAVAFYHQYPRQLQVDRHAPPPSGRLQDRLTLTIARHIGAAFYDGADAPDTLALAASLGVTTPTIDAILAPLIDHGLVSRTAGDKGSFQPAQSPENVTLIQLLKAARNKQEQSGSIEGHAPAPVRTLMGEIDASLEHALGNKSWKDLIDAD